MKRLKVFILLCILSFILFGCYGIGEGPLNPALLRWHPRGYTPQQLELISSGTVYIYNASSEDYYQLEVFDAERKLVFADILKPDQVNEPLILRSGTYRVCVKDTSWGGRLYIPPYCATSMSWHSHIMKQVGLHYHGKPTHIGLIP
jgi:hypothetical protein